MSATIGAGRFVAWDGGCLFIGRHHTAVPIHAHQAIQLVVGRNAPHLVRAGASAPWIEYSAAVIASRQSHSIDVTKADYGIVVFVEPETREGRAISERHLREGVAEAGSAALETAAHHLFDTWLRSENEHAIAAAATLSARLESRHARCVVVHRGALRRICRCRTPDSHVQADVRLRSILDAAGRESASNREYGASYRHQCAHPASAR